MLRSHEDDTLNAKQNATNERSAAAMLDQATERELYQLFKAHFSEAEGQRSWNVWNDIAWTTPLPPPSAALIGAVLELYKDSALLPDYAAQGLSLLRASRGRAWFWTRWNYEESKHQLGLQEWLVRRGGWEDSAVRALTDTLLTEYFWEPPCLDAACVLVDALLFELLELEKLTALKALAEAEGESVLVTLTGHLIADDEGQRDFMIESLRIVARSYPETVEKALDEVARAHEAPELTAKLQVYLMA